MITGWIIQFCLDFYETLIDVQTKLGVHIYNSWFGENEQNDLLDN